MNTTNNQFDEEEDKPLDPAVERIRRRMLRLQIISIGIMMIGLLAVIIAIVFKVSNREEEAPVAAATSGGSALPVQAGVSYTGEIDIPDGASIVGSSIKGDQVLLQILLSNGATQLWFYDVRSARVFGKIDVK